MSVVWAHTNDYDRWTPYPPEVSNGVEKIFSANSSTGQNGNNNSGRIQLGPFSSSWTGYEIDIANMRQCQANSGRRFHVHRYVLDSSQLLATGFVWEFEGDTPYQWFPYDLPLMTSLESAYRKTRTSKSGSKNSKHSLVDLRKSLNHAPYVIDVISLQQTRMDTGKVRNIQRRALSQPYVADASGNPGSSHVHQYPQLDKRALYRGHSQSVVTRSAMQQIQTAGSTQQQQQQQAIAAQATIQQLAAPAPTTAAAQKSAKRKTVQKSAAATAQRATGAAAQQSASTKAAQQQPKKKQRQSKPGSPAKSGQAREPLPSENNIKITATLSPPKSAEEVLGEFTTIIDLGEEEEEDDEEQDENQDESENHECCICYERLSSPSGYGEDGDDDDDAYTVVELDKCGHRFHWLCLLAMHRATLKDEGFQCPSCKLIYGQKRGNCPAGVMAWGILKGTSVAGYEGHDTICVSYDIQPGIQGLDHPKPGQRYHTQGFPREGYLPDTNEGRKILKLMIEAWRRRLMFTVGTSYTTGSSDVVTWNEIHHKTELYGNYSGHGYPDPGYLMRVLLELADHGVTDDCL